MADSIEVTLTLGYDGGVLHALDAYLTGPLGVPDRHGGADDQHLHLVCGGPGDRNLPGSGQAGTVRIYAGCIRRGNPDAVIEYLRGAPWGQNEAVVVIHHDFGGPAYVRRLGYVPVEDRW